MPKCWIAKGNVGICKPNQAEYVPNWELNCTLYEDFAKSQIFIFLNRVRILKFLNSVEVKVLRDQCKKRFWDIIKLSKRGGSKKILKLNRATKFKQN